MKTISTSRRPYSIYYKSELCPLAGCCGTYIYHLLCVQKIQIPKFDIIFIASVLAFSLSICSHNPHKVIVNKLCGTFFVSMKKHKGTFVGEKLVSKKSTNDSEIKCFPKGAALCGTLPKAHEFFSWDGRTEYLLFFLFVFNCFITCICRTGW